LITSFARNKVIVRNGISGENGVFKTPGIGWMLSTLSIDIFERKSFKTSDAFILVKLVLAIDSSIHETLIHSEIVEFFALFTFIIFIVIFTVKNFPSHENAFIIVSLTISISSFRSITSIAICFIEINFATHDPI
jgi:hypothetical protein